MSLRWFLKAALKLWTDFLFSSFSANTLLVQYVHNVLHVSPSLSVPVLVFFHTVLQLFALVFCFGDQVLSPGSSLATDFLGVVPLWRVAQTKFFQPCTWFSTLRTHRVSRQKTLFHCLLPTRT